MAYPIRHLIVAFLYSIAGTLLAQSSPPASIRFTVFAAKPIVNIGYVSPAGSIVPITFNPVSRSTAHVYSGPSPLRFVDISNGQVVAEAVVPPQIRQPLFLFTDLSGANSRKLRFQIAVLDDSAAKLPVGHLAIVNLSGIELNGTLGNTELVVAKGWNVPVSVSRSAQLKLFAKVRTTRVQAYADTIRLPRASRMLLILFPPARKGAFEVQSRALMDELSTR